MSTTSLIPKGTLGYSKQQKQLREASAVPKAPTVQPATPTVPTSMPVSASSAARGVVAYGQGGNAIYAQGNAPSNVIPTAPVGTTASTTVVSNKNKQQQIPKIVGQLDGFSSDRGMTSDGETTRYADGSIYQDQQQMPSEDEIYGSARQTPEWALLEQLRQSLDASTSSQIAGIQQQIEQRRMETNEYSRNQSKAAERSRLMVGQSQASPSSMGSLLNAQEKYRLKQISALDAQEINLINAAKEAQRSGKYEILSKQIALIQGIRKQKQDEIAAVNKSIVEQNKKINEKIYQAERENAVADLYQSGVTNVASIMDSLEEQGVSMTAKEIRDTLDNLVPPGLNDLVQTLQNNGAPQATVQKVMQSQDLSEAYKNAGGWASDASGKLGEYNLYRAQAMDTGIVPLGYQQWIDYNENQELKRQQALKGTLTGNQRVSGGVTTKSSGTVPSQMSTSSDPFVQKLIATKGGGKVTDTTIQKLDKGLSVLGQLGVLQENINGVKTGPIVGAFKDKNPWDNKAQVIKAQLNAIVPNLARGIYGEVGVLTDNDIAQYSKTIPNLKSTEEVRDAVMYITLDMIGKSIKNTLNVNASANRDVSGFVDIYEEMENTKNSILQTIPGADVPQSIKQDAGTQLIQQQKQVAKNIDEIYKTLSPKIQDVVDSLYLKDYNDMQVEEYLKLKGFIK